MQYDGTHRFLYKEKICYVITEIAKIKKLRNKTRFVCVKNEEKKNKSLKKNGNKIIIKVNVTAKKT